MHASAAAHLCKHKFVSEHEQRPQQQSHHLRCHEIEQRPGLAMLGVLERGPLHHAPGMHVSDGRGQQEFSDETARLGHHFELAEHLRMMRNR